VVISWQARPREPSLNHGNAQPHTYFLSCHRYNYVPSLVFVPAEPQDGFYQKPGTPPIPTPPPTPPPPPAPPTPPPLSCEAWTNLPQWTAAGCGTDGASCLITVDVTSHDGVVVSHNVLPFQPPKSMRLPAAAVTATVGVPAPDGTVPVRIPNSQRSAGSWC
jgi:hypothetical protein